MWLLCVGWWLLVVVLEALGSTPRGPRPCVGRPGLGLLLPVLLVPLVGLLCLRVLRACWHPSVGVMMGVCRHSLLLVLESDWVLLSWETVFWRWCFVAVVALLAWGFVLVGSTCVLCVCPAILGRPHRW